MKPKLLFVAGDAAYFVSHRLPIALAAKEVGYDVHVACGDSAFGIDLGEHGISYHKIRLVRGGLNPVTELWSAWSLWRLFRRLRPSLVHLIAIKPVLYGGIAARLAGVPAVVSAVSGLGSIFIEGGGLKTILIRVVAVPMYRIALRHSRQRVIFQNPDDRKKLIGVAGISESKTVLIRGSGVDLKRYPYRVEPPGFRIVTMASRLLRDKGVYEFVDAARALRAKGAQARFWLIGAPDVRNPTSISSQQVALWQQEGVVECLGHRSNVPQLYSQSHVIVLPSYREGLPKSLIEAAACGRPVVTTDVPGCRDAIEENVTGLLVPPRDAKSLEEGLARLLADDAMRRCMGRAGRELAEREFQIEKVVAAHLQIYDQLKQ